MLAAWLIIGICALGVLHTYVVYPRWMRRWWRLEEAPAPAYAPESWPSVAVLMAVHNEEAVLTEKLESLLASTYPGQVDFLVGSDNSTDRTNEILEWYDGYVDPVIFASRRGKPGIINRLAGRSGAEIFVITDASVMLEPTTIQELVRPMVVDERVGVVDSRVVHTGVNKLGISALENEYINGEVALKQAESNWAGVMMGPFGGCYALRASAFSPVPDNFLVDDFYLCMLAFERGFRARTAGAAVVREGIGQDVAGEFRRKVRISSGNWQNLVRFRKLWWPPWRNKLAFAFFSHKILRWVTPFLLLTGGLALAAVSPGLATIVLLFPLLCWLLDALLRQIGLHVQPLRAVTYFLSMNVALLVGFFRFLTGIRSNVWQPSSRH